MTLATSYQGVAAILRKAGHTASTSSTTSVRGWHNVSSGFQVRKPTFQGSFIARVEHQVGRWEKDAATVTQARLKVYEALLVDMGYKVERGSYSGPDAAHDHTLWVSIPEGEA